MNECNEKSNRKKSMLIAPAVKKGETATNHGVAVSFFFGNLLMALAVVVLLELGLIGCSSQPPAKTIGGSASEVQVAYSLSNPKIGALGIAPPGGVIASATYGILQKPSTEEYQRITDNPFMKTVDNPVSTFSIDVDTASYSNVKRFLQQSSALPSADAVRIEELVNYFNYPSYGSPGGADPVSASFAMAPAPWNGDHILVRIALKARQIETENLPPASLVFLLDTSGSMADDNKLPLIKKSLKILVDRMRPQDRISIVTYSSTTQLTLPSTPGNKKETIMSTIDSLEAGGSTAGYAGLVLAYETARKYYAPGGNNRVILCTDGDFNVGTSSTSELERLIEKERDGNVYLTVIGVGMFNLKDTRLETLADKGNGNYAYLDTLLEGMKIFGKEIWGNLFVVAKDVKIQIEFNPSLVREYRLIGYENRLLAREDFNNDTKDAGEMGSGQTVTAFYELVPVSAQATDSGPNATPPVTPLEFQQTSIVPSSDLLAFRLRYKVPGEGQESSKLMSWRVAADPAPRSFESMDEDFRFASAVVEFGMMLRDSPYKGSSSWQSLISTARGAKGSDSDENRAEFVKIAELAEELSRD
jgi:Ca-activated chloride channel family protein